MKYLLLVALAYSLSCTSVAGAGPSRSLHLAVGPFLSSPADTEVAYAPLRDYLAQALQQPVVLTGMKSWDDLSQAINDGSADLALMAPLSYVVSHYAGGAEVVATLLSDGHPFFHGIIVVNGNSAINSLQQLKGKTFAFGNRGAFSGWLLPLYHLQQALGMKTPEGLFAKVSYDIPWMSIEESVVAKTLDAGTDWDGNREAMIESGQIAAEESRILWESPPIPNDALVVSKSLAGQPGFIQRLQNALTAISSASGILPPHSTGFIVQNDSFYRPVLDVALAEGVVQPKTHRDCSCPRGVTVCSVPNPACANGHEVCDHGKWGYCPSY